jgi:hypothetical protein
LSSFTHVVACAACSDEVMVPCKCNCCISWYLSRSPLRFLARSTQSIPPARFPIVTFFNSVNTPRDDGEFWFPIMFDSYIAAGVCRCICRTCCPQHWPYTAVDPTLYSRHHVW